MIAASIVSNRRFRPSVDQSRSQVEDQQAARAASVAAAERVKVAALLAARTGDFQDIAEALGIDDEEFDPGMDVVRRDCEEALLRGSLDEVQS